MSKKTILILLACIVTLAAVYAAARKRPETNTPDEAQSTMLEVIARAEGGSDEDGDGLKNWEENLWGTSESNPDTDGDGTSDGDEVREGRNPALAGPDDSISKQAATTATAEAEGDLTLTDTFAREFFGKYVSAKGQGTLSEADQILMVDTLVSSKTLTQKPKRYSVNDIRLAPYSDPVSVRNYGNMLGSSMKIRSAGLGDNEMRIFVRGLQSYDTKQLEELDTIIEAYRGLISDHLATPVPSDAAQIHVNFINSMAAVLDSIESMRVVFDDPVKAYIGVSSYITNVSNMAQAIYSLNTYFQAKGVVFEQSEDGYVVVHSI